MSEKSKMERLDWPKWTWRGSNWWIGVAGLLVSFFAVVFPQITQFDLMARVGFVLALTVVITLLILLANHLRKLSGVLYKRVKGYPPLHLAWRETDETLTRAKQVVQQLVDRWEKEYLFERMSVQFDREKVFIRIGRNPDMTINAGTCFDVIDLTDGWVLGRFRVTTSSRESHIAEQEHMDPLWYGDIKQRNQTSFLPPPNSVAVLIKDKE